MWSLHSYFSNALLWNEKNYCDSRQYLELLWTQRNEISMRTSFLFFFFSSFWNKSVASQMKNDSRLKHKAQAENWNWRRKWKTRFLFFFSNIYHLFWSSDHAMLLKFDELKTKKAFIMFSNLCFKTLIADAVKFVQRLRVKRVVSLFFLLPACLSHCLIVIHFVTRRSWRLLGNLWGTSQMHIKATNYRHRNMFRQVSRLIHD